MSKNNKILNCFWLPSNCYNICVSGANENTIKSRSHNYQNSNEDKYFQKHILPSLRRLAITGLHKQKFLPKSCKNPNGFREVVNDALREIYAKRTGYVFSKDQLLEILRFVPDVGVSFNNGIYFICRQGEEK